MAAIAQDQVITITKIKMPGAGLEGTSEEKYLGRGSIGIVASTSDDPLDSEHKINEDDLRLRRVSGKIPWTAYSVAFVELCERFSYYGTTVVCVCLQQHVVL
jgi:hypothetical protein